MFRKDYLKDIKFPVENNQNAYYIEATSLQASSNCLLSSSQGR